MINFIKWLYKKYKEENPTFKDQHYMNKEYMQSLEINRAISMVEKMIEELDHIGACELRRSFNQEYVADAVAEHFNSVSIKATRSNQYAYEGMYYVILDWSEIR